MDTLKAMQQVVDQTAKIVEGTKPSQLGDPTPCTQWTVRDVINHITGGSIMFAVCIEEGSVPDELLGQLMGGDNLGDDYKSAFRKAANRALDAGNQQGALEKMVKLPFGEMPAGVALNLAVFDVTTHAADLARATGQTIEDTELLDTALEVGRQMVGPEMREHGLFDPEQPAPANANAADRLLAFAGRRV
jgi:uncharacterized protein (TIGR03086 family)